MYKYSKNFIFFFIFLLTNKFLFSEEILFDSIRIVGNTLPNIKYNKYDGNLEKYINDILNEYSNQGYLNAFAEIRKIEKDSVIYKITLFIDKKERFIVENIVINDNFINSNFLKKVLINRDNYLNISDIKIGIEKLKGYNFIKDLYLKDIIKNSSINKCTIILEGENQKNIFLSGIAGFSKGNEITGNIYLKIDNIFNYAQRLDFSWQKNANKNKKIYIKYFIPYFWITDFDLEGMYLNNFVINKYSEFSANLSFIYNKNTLFDIGYGIEYDKLINMENKLTEKRFYNKLIAKINKKNWHTSVEIGFNTKKDYKYKFYNQIYKEFDYFSFANNLKIEKNSLENVLSYGGAESFRGVLENFFTVKYYCYMNNNFILGKRNKFIIFFDTAYDNYKEYKYSYGAGINLMNNENNNINISVGFFRKIDFENGIIHLKWSKYF